jgi:hypothetical protein
MARAAAIPSSVRRNDDIVSAYSGIEAPPDNTDKKQQETPLSSENYLPFLIVVITKQEVYFSSLSG